MIGGKLSSIEAHEHNVVSCSVDESKNRVLSAGWDKFVHMWDIESGAKLVKQLHYYYCGIIRCCVSGHLHTIIW